MIQRAVLLIAALVAVAWFAVTWQDARRVGRAQATVNTARPPRTQLESALSDADHAGALNPDRTTALSFEVALNVRLGRYRPALAATERLVRLEPQNAEAWAFLATLSAQRDPRLAARALARAKQLDPSYRRSAP